MCKLCNGSENNRKKCWDRNNCWKKGNMIPEIIATCISCGRKFKTTRLAMQLVQEGKAESLCAMCDGTHDDDIVGNGSPKNRQDYDYPPEQENYDEEKRHGL